MRAIAMLLAVATAATASGPTPTLNTLVHSSDRVVTGKLSVGKAAKLSVVMNVRASQPSEIVVTYITVTPTDDIIGESSGPLMLRLLGGHWDDYAVIDVTAPNITEGEEAILFLAESDMPGPRGETVHFLPFSRNSKFDLVSQNGKRRAVPAISTSRLGLEADGHSVGARWIEYEELKRLVRSAAEKPAPESTGCRAK